MDLNEVAAREPVLATHSEEHAFPAKEEAIEAQAFMDLYRLAPRHLRDKEHFDCFPMSGGCAISLPGAPALGLNRILGLGTVKDLERAYEWMRRRQGVRILQLNVGAAREEVLSWLHKKGLHEHGPGWVKLTRSTRGGSLPSTSSIRTRRVQLDEALLFGTMMCDGFKFPATLAPLWSAIVGKEGWSCFFALDGVTPIGTGAIYVSGSYAWVGGGTTIPEFRNRGVQKALIQARIEDGIARGAATLVVETEVPSPDRPNISYENLKRMGFQHAYDRKNFKL